jgi:hypothetical protein
MWRKFGQRVTQTVLQMLVPGRAHRSCMVPTRRPLGAEDRKKHRR